MSKPMEPASLTTPSLKNPVNHGASQKVKNPKDDLSLRHMGVAVGVFAVMVGLFGYGFYVQQARVNEKEASLKISDVPTLPQSGPSRPLTNSITNGVAEAATVPAPVTAVTVKPGPIAVSTPAQIESVHADIYFDFGKTRLRADAIATLQQQAEIMKQDGHWAILLQGYTDRHGSIEYNRSLALRRGESAKQYLVELGIPPDSIKVVSLGQDAALCDDQTVTCKHLNRRVHLELVKLETPLAPDTSTTPAVPAPDQTSDGSRTISDESDQAIAISPAEEIRNLTPSLAESH